jgi:signal transduction histidine kinase
MKPFWRSLRFRLVLLVVCAAIPAFALIILNGVQSRQQAAMDAQAEMLRLAREASMEQQDLVDEAHRLLQAMAQIPAVRSADPATCSGLLSNLLTGYKIYTNLAVIRPDGQLACSGMPLQPGTQTNESDRKFFQQAVASKRFSYADYVIGRVSGKPSLLTGLPVLDGEGRVQVVIHAGIDLSWLSDFSANERLPQGSRLAVANRGGTLLMRYPSPEQWVGRNLADTGLVSPRIARGESEGSGEGVGAEGVPRIYGFTALGMAEAPGDEVFVSVAVPSAAAYDGANRRLAENLIGLGVVVLLALLAAWFGSSLFLLRRVRALVALARQLASGDLAARSGLEHDGSELGELGRAFDDMAGSLQRRNAEGQRAEAERSELLDEIDQERATLAGILGSMNQGAIMIQADGRVRYCSARAAALLGREPANVVGVHANELIANVRAWAGLDAAVLPDLEDLRAMLPGSPTFELSVPGTPPHDLSIDLFTVPIGSGEPGFGILIRDVTLERNAARTKDSVISTVSHELRTPLTSIRSYSEMLLDRDDDPAARKEFLEIINAESERLTRLLNEVLDLTTIDSGQAVWNVARFHLAPLVRESARLYAPLARERSLSLELDLGEPLPLVASDPDRMRQVINNLLDNAIKFTEQGRIRLATRAVDGEVRLLVADSGQGIPREDLERIFDRFHQGGTTRSGKPRGIGLGLSICSEIVRRSGGRIWAESMPGQGSTFVVALPVAEPVAAQETSAAAAV